jgi:hypothetical protein
VSVLSGLGDGTFAPATSVAIGSALVGITASDFNGDGKADLAMANYGGSTVSILIGQRAYRAAGVTAVNGTATIGGVSGNYTLSQAAGVMTIVTPGGTERLVASALRGVGLLSGVNLTVNSDLGAVGGSRRVSVLVSTGATTTFNTSQHLAGLDVFGVVTLAAGGNKLLRLSSSFSYSPAGGSYLDLNDNSMIFDNAVGAPLTTFFRNVIATGRADGAWTGSGITSTSARNNPLHNTTLGYLGAPDYKALYGPNATFAGEAISNSAVLIKYALYGDTDLDGGVSINDFNRLSTSFGTASGQSGFTGDFDNDGGVSINDFNLLSASFGRTLPVAAATPAVATKAKKMVVVKPLTAVKASPPVQTKNA